jgi:hypothetical protein
MSKLLLGVHMHLPPQPTLLILIRSYEPQSSGLRGFLAVIFRSYNPLHNLGRCVGDGSPGGRIRTNYS